METGYRIGPYEITAKLGEGGMGEVYRARDTKLNRDVAIKVLPEAFTADPDRLARFKREAQVLASLNHPNIAHIYGLEGQAGQEGLQGTLALVMELVEGEGLDEKIGSGLKAQGSGMALEDALAIARQIAEALEAAHDQGIIHRDLKPANIKVRDDGRVKVLDFGLAKAMAPAGAGGPDRAGAAGPNLSMSPTMTSPAFSQMGMILGTAAYMAPEQAAGKPVDRRADIWAFGVVLWEMLTGRRLFDGETVSHTLADVLRAPIDLNALPDATPRVIRDLVARCLDRDVTTRLRDIGEARIAIQRWFANPQAEITNDRAAPLPAAPRGRSFLAWGVAGVLAVSSVALAFTAFRHAPAAAPRRHLSVPLPEDSVTGFFALSPDGRSVVLTYGNGLAIRSLETGDQRPLTGTDRARAPFWSPDGRNIAFVSFTDRTLKVVTASGGEPQVLCRDVDAGGGGAWGRNGTILYVSSYALMRVSASGGECTPIAKGVGDGAVGLPVFLPDGQHFLYAQSGTDKAQRGLFVASLGNPAGKRLLADYSSGLFAPDAPGSSRGRLLFVREQTLMAQSFDAASLTLSGDPVAVANHVDFTNNQPQIAASVSDDGTLMYMTNTHVDRQMIWYDRAGAEVARAAGTGATSAALALSPDGKRVAFRRRDPFGDTSLWMQDLERNQEISVPAPRLGFGPPVWAPDGQHLATSGGQSQQEIGIWVIDTTGGQRRLVLPGSTAVRRDVSDWSRDGRWLLYTEQDPKTGADIWELPMRDGAAAGKPVLLVRTPAVESQAQLSPDGKWVAYISLEGSGAQVLVRQFNGDAPLGDARWQASEAKTLAREPRWRADSKELFYIEGSSTPQYRVVAVPIGAGPNPLGSPRTLFSFRTITTVPQSNVFVYAPAPDGQRFLVDSFASDDKPTLEVILNWAGAGT